jgi:vesicle coat complex subunit
VSLPLWYLIVTVLVLCPLCLCLPQESDPSARRNAFIMLFNCAQDLAVEYFLAHMDDVQSYGDGFQLIVLELSRKVRSIAAIALLR